jgi:hypothetical protein
MERKSSSKHSKNKPMSSNKNQKHGKMMRSLYNGKTLAQVKKERI